MQINRKTLDGLLSLNDKQLMALIGNLAKNNGVDLSEFQVDPSDVQSIRRALSGITDEDINKIVAQYTRAKNGGR
jgi:hypothetical protein